jgi:hypothetical protein
LELILRDLKLSNAHLDHLGIVASCACVAHCVLTPVLISALPILGLNFLVEEQMEWIFVGAAALIGGFSLVPAYLKRHRKCRSLLLFASGILLLLVARLWIEEKIEVPVVIAGMLLIVSSHLINLRLCQSCELCAE